MSDHYPIHYKIYKDSYKKIREVGAGTFGTVTLAKSKDPLEFSFQNFNYPKTLLRPLPATAFNHKSGLVAIKSIKKKLYPDTLYTRLREIRFITSVTAHPNLIQVYEIFIDMDLDGTVHIVMEPAAVNLHRMIKARQGRHFSCATLLSLCTQLLAAIRHIHSHGFMHRDIKPENIVVMLTSEYYGSSEWVPPYRLNDNYILKLVDYGLARQTTSNSPFSLYVSTRWYRAPELLLRACTHDCMVDIWAFGTVCVEIGNLGTLFPGRNDFDMFLRVQEVLGTPWQMDVMGGFWPEALPLVHRREAWSETIDRKGYKKHEALFRRAVPNWLHFIAKRTLVWNPELRATAEELATASEFGRTMLQFSTAKLLSEDAESFSNYETISYFQKLVEAPNTSPGRGSEPVDNVGSDKENNFSKDWSSFVEVSLQEESRVEKVKGDSVGVLRPSHVS
ncbi:mitogen-activated protein kinase Kss1p [Diutina catenulata]